MQEDDVMDQIDCTFKNFGDSQILQPLYLCPDCNLDYICIKCIKTCNKSCVLIRKDCLNSSKSFSI
jgi:hypothetical protein